MICSTCGTENEAGRKFCLECGARLAAGCPSCGAPNPATAKFCGECGTALAGEVGALPARAAVTTREAAPPAVAERRLVSVLFADLVGFTALAEGRDPEETRELLSRYFDLSRDVIGRYGGTIEKFIGDAVMAVWGAPVAREDDAERAVRAGLELVDAVRVLGPSIAARAGVLTGEAVVTLGATGEGMVAGDLVNTASRLQSVAPSGTVLVGEATERAASKAIVFEPAGEQVLKGKVAPVTAFRALRVVAETGGRNRSEVLEAPFVGRDDELRLLKDLFHATGRDKRARLVSVMGPAGIGKSRLAWEFLKYVDGLVQDTYWHDGRSPAYGEGITFWALGEMVRGRCGLLETDDEATTRTKVGEAVGRWIGDEQERRWVEAALLALLGAEGAQADGPDELFAAWRAFFERIADVGTVVMVFEDLQWADAGLLDFIDHVLEWSKARPIYVIALARPELLERRPGWGAGKRNFTNLSLEPLRVPAMRELLAGLVPGLPERVGRTIVERADGIPLYAVETVRMLVAEGRLREEAGVYHPVGDLTDLAVPETLQELIAARLDALEPADRSVLQDAAVLGQSFTVAGLTAVSGGDEAVLGPRLRGLVQRELLTLEADPRSPERGQYAFVQALIREVAYGTLARADRKARHLAAARWFETLGEGELAGALAGHYLAAHRNSPPGPEADALGVQARLALKAAAERAAALGSYRQALGFLRQALEITDDPAERAALWERAADAALNDGDFDAARSYLDDALAWYREQGNGVAVARAATQLGVVLQGLYQHVAAVKALEAAVAETADLESEPAVVGLLTELSRAYGNAQDPRALETVDRALAAAERLELTSAIAEGLINRALVLSYAGRLQEPNALLRGVIDLAESHGLASHTRLRALNNLSAGLVTEDWRGAAQVEEEAIELARRLGNKGWLNQFLQGHVGTSIWVGEWVAADRLIAELDPSDLAVPSALGLGEGVAILHAFRGEAAEADATLASLEPLRAAMDDPRAPGWQHLWEAVIHALGGRLEKAYAAGVASAGVTETAIWGAEWATRAAIWLRDQARAREAHGLHRAVRRSGRLIVADRLNLGAGLAALEGDTQGALAGYRDAVRRYRDLDLPLHLGFCLLDFGTLLGWDVREAAAAAEEARAIFERLGSPPLLARLDAGLAGWTGGAAARGTAAPVAALSRSAGPRPGRP